MNTLDLFQKLKENKGLTVTKDLREFTRSGYAVALPDKETKILESDLDLSKFTSLLNDYSKQLADNQNIGLWIDQNIVYFDISEVIADKDQALKIAKERKQLAIFDFNSLESIYL